MSKFRTTLARSALVAVLFLSASSVNAAAASDAAASTPAPTVQNTTASSTGPAASNPTQSTKGKDADAGLSATHLAGLVSLILALSVASERLVEIVKGFVPALNKAIPATDEKSENAEARRQAYLQILAVIAGVFTAFMARDYIPKEIAAPTETWKILGMGLLASGGSGFWNSVLTYVTKVKDIKKVEADEAKKAAGK